MAIQIEDIARGRFDFRKDEENVSTISEEKRQQLKEEIAAARVAAERWEKANAEKKAAARKSESMRRRLKAIESRREAEQASKADAEKLQVKAKMAAMEAKRRTELRRDVVESREELKNPYHVPGGIISKKPDVAHASADADHGCASDFAALLQRAEAQQKEMEALHAKTMGESELQAAISDVARLNAIVKH